MTKTVIRAALRKGARALRAAGIPKELINHLHFKGAFNVNLPNGAKVKLMSRGDHVENEFFWRGWKGHEQETMPWWLSFASEGGDVLDIGANTAAFSVLAKGISPSSRVVACEPVARIAARARENAKISGFDVEVIETAVADDTGTVRIYDPGGDNAYSASLDAEYLPGDKNSYDVPVITVDRLCESMKLRPHLIKIDVEGAEGRVLLGARNTMMATGCRIICEWLGDKGSHRDSIEMLNELNYVSLDPSDLSVVALSESRIHLNRNIILVPAADRSVLSKKWE